MAGRRPIASVPPGFPTLPSAEYPPDLLATTSLQRRLTDCDPSSSPAVSPTLSLDVPPIESPPFFEPPFVCPSAHRTRRRFAGSPTDRRFAELPAVRLTIIQLSSNTQAASRLERVCAKTPRPIFPYLSVIFLVTFIGNTVPVTNNSRSYFYVHEPLVHF